MRDTAEKMLDRTHGAARPFISREMRQRGERCAAELIDEVESLCEPDDVAGPHRGYTREVLTKRFLTILAKHM